MEIGTFITTVVTPVGTLLAVGLALWNFFQSPSRKNAEDIASFRKTVGEDIKLLDTAIDGVANRVIQLEALIGQVPTKDSIHDLAMGIERISGRLETMNARLDPIDHLGRRLQEVLLENRK